MGDDVVRRETRIRTALLLGSLVVAVMIAGFALLQRDAAGRNAAASEQQRTAAEEQRRRALGHQLLAEAAASGVDVDLALLLALEARTYIGDQADPVLSGLLAANPNRIATAHAGRPVIGLAVSHDGRRMATVLDDGTVELRDLPSLHATSTAAGTAAAFAPDRSELAIGGADGTVALYDEAGMWTGATPIGIGGRIERLQYSGDGRLLLAGSADDGFAVWPVGAPVTGLVRDGRYPAISADGSQLAWGEDDTVVVGSPADGGVRARLEAARGPVTAVAVTDDGTVASAIGGDGTWTSRFNVWNMHERQPATTIDLASNAITALALGPDGASVALNAESELSVWPDVISNRNAQSFQLDPGAAPVTAIGFTPDGRQIVSGSQDGTVLLWDSRRGAAASDGSQWDVVQRACIVAGRDLTPAEWTEHLGDEPYRETCPVP